MAEFFAVLNLLRDQCDENPELQQMCQTVASKYLESEKKEIRTQYAYTENIILKIEIGCLESIYRTVTENYEAQVEADSLLEEYYQEHLKFTFNIDECELEKLASYDELKFELETRDSNNMYQQLYWRKMATAKKMEERNIVKKYRKTEQEYLKLQNERLHQQEIVEKLKAKDDQFKIRRQQEVKLILELVEGLVTIARLDPQKSQSQIQIFESQRLSEITPDDINIQKGGLSSKLLVNFNQFTMPPIQPMPRIRQINPSNGLNRLLQQSEAIRKSMQTNPILLSGDIPRPKFSGILKIPKDISTAPESTPKTVSFDDNLHNVDLTRTIETQEVTQKTTADDILEIIEDSEMEESLIEKESKKTKIEITENLLIKPGGKTFNIPEVQPKWNNTTKTAASDDFKKEDPTPIKMKSSPCEASFKVNSKSFMEMFLDFSRESEEREVASPIFEPIEKPKQKLNPTPSFEIEKLVEIKEKKPIEKKNKDGGVVVKEQETKATKTKASKKVFDCFEKEFSKYANDNNMIDTANEADNDQSFDFFLGNTDAENNADDDAGSDTFSFQF